MNKTPKQDAKIRLPEDFEGTLAALLAVPPEAEKPVPKKAPKRPTRRRSS